MKHNSKKIIKGFDCIAYKRKVQEQIYQETKNMSADQYLEYVRRSVREGEIGEIWKKFQKKNHPNNQPQSKRRTIIRP